MCAGITELRLMPANQVLELCNILDIEESWKTLMSIVVNEDGANEPKFTMEHIRLIENAGAKQRRSCSEILLEEWGTSGKVRPTYSSLLKFLIKAQLFRAADYVHTTLLQRVDELKRPCHGPAAKINIPDPSDLTPSVYSSVTDAVTVVNKTPAAHKKLLSPDQAIVSVTVPVSKLVNYPREFKYSDLYKWSGNFSEKLGRGAFSSVYLCVLPDTGSSVAVKRLGLSSEALPSEQLPAQFHNELATLSLFNHENVLSLLGYSCDGPDLCLIYNYMPNGSLEDKIKDSYSDFEWKIRLDIAKGVSMGINYLHTFSEKPHIHRDIKSANILLDQQMIPKLGDFGLARPAPMQTIATSTIVGTTAYMSPEALRGDISIKMDVYSFGVVLLELVTGLLAWDENRESRSLVSYLDDIDNITTIIDKRPLKSDDELAMSLYRVSQDCLQEKKNSRPYMQIVADTLSSLSCNC